MADKIKNKKVNYLNIDWDIQDIELYKDYNDYKYEDAVKTYNYYLTNPSSYNLNYLQTYFPKGPPVKPIVFPNIVFHSYKTKIIAFDKNEVHFELEIRDYNYYQWTGVNGLETIMSRKHWNFVFNNFAIDKGIILGEQLFTIKSNKSVTKYYRLPYSLHWLASVDEVNKGLIKPNGKRI